MNITTSNIMFAIIAVLLSIIFSSIVILLAIALICICFRLYDLFILQELAHITEMDIYDNNSLEEAIKLILPSTKKIQKDKLRKIYDESDSIEYKMGIETAMDILDIYF